MLLTAFGEDGVRGLTAIAEGGGICVDQDPQEAEMPQTPLNAIRCDVVSGVFPTDDMTPALGDLARGLQIASRDPRGEEDNASGTS